MGVTTKCNSRWLSAALGLALGLLAPPTLRAETTEEHFRGKTIDFLIGAAPGGGYDLAGRLVAKHLGPNIPGQPTVVARNMPTASSLVMTNYLYNSAKRDGTVMGMTNNNIPLEPRLRMLSPDGSNIKFDITRFAWLGSPVQEPQVMFTWHTAPAKTFADLKTMKIVVGAVTVAADGYTLQALLNQTAGTRLELITGYPGQNDIFIAMERGEIQANSAGISTLTVSRPHLLKDNKVRILVQYGLERHPAFAAVPTAIELSQTEADRELWRFYTLKYAFARPIALPPEVPHERVTALQSAFDQTMKDPRYVEDAARIGLEVNPLSGPEVTRLIAQLQTTPQPVVDRLRGMLVPTASTK